MSSKAIFLLLSAFILVGCSFTGPNGEKLDIMKDEGGYYVQSSDLASTMAPAQKQTSFRAQVKGSIYETGELMSVFGTCLDGDDKPINGTTAVFSAWYPNGTKFINMTNMTEVQTGYFLHQSAMSAVEGTYLTEMMCAANVSGQYMEALAWGEWQNPFWVRRIALLNDTLANMTFNTTNLEQQIANLSNLTQQQYANLSSLSQNITIAIGNLSVNMTDSFEITWDMITSVNQTINNTYVNLNNSIYYVATLVNNSWYDNSTYIAQLLQNITNLIYNGVNNSGNPLNYTETYTDFIYMTNWKITVEAFDPVTSIKVQYPDSLCYINTTLSPIPVLMTPKGTKWTFTELLATLDDYFWTVSCVYA